MLLALSLSVCTERERHTHTHTNQRSNPPGERGELVGEDFVKLFLPETQIVQIKR